MHAKYFLIDKRANRQILKSLAELFPYFEAILTEGPLARVLEAVDLVHQSALVVPSQHSDVPRIPQFVAKQQRDHLYVIGVPVYVVALE